MPSAISGILVNIIIMIMYFSYRYDVVSIRCGRCLQKSDVLSRPPRAQWKFYCIEGK